MSFITISLKKFFPTRREDGPISSCCITKERKWSCARNRSNIFFGEILFFFSLLMSLFNSNRSYFSTTDYFDNIDWFHFFTSNWINRSVSYWVWCSFFDCLQLKKWSEIITYWLRTIIFAEKSTNDTFNSKIIEESRFQCLLFLAFRTSIIHWQWSCPMQWSKQHFDSI